MLKIHLRVNMSQLDLVAIENLLTVLGLDPTVIVHMLLLDSFLKHFELHLISLCVVDILFGFLQALGGFHFSFEFLHGIIAQFRYNLENKIPIIYDC